MSLLVLLINDLDIEHHVLRERIVELDVDLACLVEFGGLVDRVDRVSLVDVGNELEYHGSGLHVTLLLVGEDNFASDLLRDPALELDREVVLGTRLDFDGVCLDGEVWAPVELHPVADGVLRWVAELDVLCYHVTEHGRELNLGLGDIVRKSLVELNAEE